MLRYCSAVNSTQGLSLCSFCRLWREHKLCAYMNEYMNVLTWICWSLYAAVSRYMTACVSSSKMSSGLLNMWYCSRCLVAITFVYLLHLLVKFCSKSSTVLLETSKLLTNSLSLWSTMKPSYKCKCIKLHIAIVTLCKCNLTILDEISAYDRMAFFTLSSQQYMP